MANAVKVPSSRADISSAAWAAERFEVFYPDAGHRRHVVASLAESAREAHRLMPNSWGVTLTNEWFRMNLGQVNVFIGGVARVLLLVERGGAMRVAPHLLARESSYASAPGCDIATLPVDALGPFYAKLHQAHFNGLALVKKRGGYTWPDVHSVGLIHYLVEAGEQVSQPDYVDLPSSGGSAASDSFADVEPPSEGLGPDGARRFALHQQLERNVRLVDEAKREWAALDPLLSCEVCGFSFLERYGSSYVEAHHRTPMASLVPGEAMATEATIRDLAAVCANCHRMLHKEQRVTMAGLRARVTDARSTR